MRPRATPAPRSSRTCCARATRRSSSRSTRSRTSCRSGRRELKEIYSGLAKMRAEESTALYDAVVYSLYNFLGVKGQKALVLVTDGKDTVSKFTYEQALEYAQRAAVPIYTIGIGIRGLDVDTKSKLNRLTTETGGSSYYIENVAELSKIYSDIQNELRSQYVLGFYPARRREAGRQLARSDGAGGGRKGEDDPGVLPLIFRLEHHPCDVMSRRQHHVHRCGRRCSRTRRHVNRRDSRAARSRSVPAACARGGGGPRRRWRGERPGNCACLP